MYRPETDDQKIDRLTQTHTPGPWTMEFGCVYRVGSREYGPDGDEMSRIALMDRDNHLTTPTERDANARLIAAAPALLEALQDIIETVECSTVYEVGCNCAICRAGVVIAFAAKKEER